MEYSSYHTGKFIWYFVIVFNVMLLMVGCTQILVKPQYSIEYFHKTQDTTQNASVIVIPQGTITIRGFIVLLPGFGELPEEVLHETTIYKAAAAKDYMTIIPALSDWSTLYIDASSQQGLERLLNEMVEKYHLQGKPFILGGFSLGGTGAVLYAERALTSTSSSTSMPKPIAVVGIDPPLDFERFSLNAIKAVQRLHLDKQKDIQKNEDLYIITTFEQTFGGNLRSSTAFQQATPYIRSDTTMVSIRPLARLPFRLYCESDYQYWKKSNEYFDFQSNELDCASMIADLRGLGNTNATLILTQDKGFRFKENRRHPHSWSIVDGKELMEWIENITSK